MKRLEAGDFNLDELIKRLTKALVNESQRNEILELTGDTAMLIIECLDKVSERRLVAFLVPSAHHGPGHLI